MCPALISLTVFLPVRVRLAKYKVEALNSRKRKMFGRKMLRVWYSLVFMIICSITLLIPNDRHNFYHWHTFRPIYSRLCIELCWLSWHPMLWEFRFGVARVWHTARDREANNSRQWLPIVSLHIFMLPMFRFSSHT